MIQEPEIASSFSNLALHTQLKHLPIGATTSNALAQIDAAASIIIEASGKTNVPVEMIQAIMYRETICYGMEDLLDFLPGHSKGLMQIKAQTAYESEVYFNKKTLYTVEDIEKLIKDDSHNIYYGALTLSRWASEYGVNLMNASENEIGLVFSSYNAGRKLSQIGPYGEATLSYYLAFRRHVKEFMN